MRRRAQGLRHALVFAAVALPASLLVLTSAQAVVSAGEGAWPRQNPSPHGDTLAAVLARGPSTDTTPPTTSASGNDDNWHNSAVVVTLTAGDDPGGSGVGSITCSVDGGAPTTVAAATTVVTIAAPADHSGDGVHVIAFHATDNALNVESPDKTVTVKIDTTPPTTTVGGADARWHDKSVTLALAATDAPGGSGVAHTQFSRDGGLSWNGATSVVVGAPGDHSGDGLHEIICRSIDGAGNTEPVQSVTVRIDTRPPRFRWLGVDPAIVRTTGPVRCRFAIGEPTGAVRLTELVYDQYGVRVARRGGQQRDPGVRSLGLGTRYADGDPFMPGLYRVRLVLTDQAGNRTRSTLRAFRDERPVKARVWRRVPGAGRRVALTFDDGNSAAAWRSELETLRAHHAHATFFPLGPIVASNRALARRTIADGDAIGSHGWTHTLMPAQSLAGVRDELKGSAGAWWWAARATPAPYMRPPYGSWNATTLAAAGSLGFARVILWDVDPQDWSGISSAEITQRVLSHVHSGAIVCLHILPNTAAALPAILSGLRARGYRAVSLPELFRAAGLH